MSLTLYNYFRSSASYRVRIVLNLKQLDYDYAPVHLLKGGGEHFGETYRRMSPQQLVPLLKHDNKFINQSLAIIEYLDETQPDPPLLPAGPADRAYVRALALDIACEIHPLNNLRVLRYLKHKLDLDDAAKTAWIRHWINLGFEALERKLRIPDRRGRYCFGDAPTMADCCLIPQMYNARRFGVDLKPYPTLMEIEAACEELDAFRNARPENQPDTE